MCLFDDNYEVDDPGAASPSPSPSPPLALPNPNPNPSADVATDSSPSEAAINQLVSAYEKTHGAARNCRAEGIALATAGAKTAVSLATAVLTAPTEVALPLTLGKFIVDAMLLGAATAQFVNCRDDAAAKAK